MSDFPIIDIRELDYRPRGQVVLDNVHLRLEAGCHCVVLGANGSGKTTLLRMLTAELWPHSGSIRVFGEKYGECVLPELRRRIGWVSSAFKRRFRPSATAQQVVLSGFEAAADVFRRFEESEHRAAREALERLGCGELGERGWQLLSQGERQRVLLARGLLHRPELLLLDEPCVGLDPLATRRFLSDLNVLLAGPDAPLLVYVTHHLEEIPATAHRVLLLRQGRVLADGAPGQCLTDGLLSECYGAPCRVGGARGAWRLEWDAPLEGIGGDVK